jgi:hypothetical protein
VYFAAAGQVVPGEGDPDPSKPKLYLWEDDGTAQGAVRFIATLDEVGFGAIPDSNNWAWDNRKVAQATPDGSHLVFQSRANITGFDPAGTSQVYLYSADGGGSGAAELACLSCPGVPPSGSSFTPSFFGIAPSSTAPPDQKYPRSISVDGARVVFSSPDGLVGQDTNGEYDPYLWDGGELALLSSGTSPDASNAFAISASGDDAFLRTRQPLVPQDGDTLSDIYTAHVNGGFASQHAFSPPECEGDACTGPASAPAPRQPPGSAAHHGAGNPGEDRCHRLLAKARRKLRRARSAPPTRAAQLRRQAKKQRKRARRCRSRQGSPTGVAR